MNGAKTVPRRRETSPVRPGDKLKVKIRPPSGKSLEQPRQLHSQTPTPRTTISQRRVETVGHAGRGAKRRFTGPAVIAVKEGQSVFLQLLPGETFQILEGESFVVSNEKQPMELETTYHEDNPAGSRDVDLIGAPGSQINIYRFATQPH